MLTPLLEKLIMQGKASFQTYTAGGGQNSRLKVGGDRYIVIVGFTHFPYVPSQFPTIDDYNNLRVTQMNVSSDKSFNSFVFRNNVKCSIALDAEGGLTNCFGSGSPVSVDTYLTHEDDVNFQFSLGTELLTTVSGIYPEGMPSKQLPTGYGKRGFSTFPPGLPGSQKRNLGATAGEYKPVGDLEDPTIGKTSSFDQLQFPVENNLTNFDDNEVQNIGAYPIVLVQYVEILGNPTDIQSST